MDTNKEIVRNSLKFIFDVASHEVILEADQKGNERVLINGEIIESKKSFRLSGTFKFIINEVNYEINVKVLNPITGVMEATLSKNGEAIIKQRATVKLGKKNKLLSNIMMIISFISLGFAVGNGYLPIWLTLLLYLIAVVGSASLRNKLYVIEEKNT